MLKHRRRKARRRGANGAREAVKNILKTATPAEYANYIKNAGYEHI